MRENGSGKKRPLPPFVDVRDLKRAASCARVCVGVGSSLDREGHICCRRTRPQSPAAALSVCLPA